MSIAEDLAGKHLKEHYRINSIGGLPAQGFDATVAAINEALELAAQEAEKVAQQNDADAEQGWYQQNNWLAETAARIRALKSPAQEPESA